MQFNIFITLLLILATTSAQAARLNASLDKKSASFGEPLQLRIVANTDLTPLDLAPLKKDFELFSSAISGGTQNGKAQSVLEATLYPLRTGKLSVPALALDNASSAPLSVEILPTKVSLRAWVSPAAPMVREPAILHLEILDEGELTWTAPTQLVAPNIYLGAVTETTREVQYAGATMRLREYHWPLLALKHDGQSVSFPMLDTYKFGQRMRYPVTPVTFRALPAPAYLPLYLPIGQPNVRVEPIPLEIIRGRPLSRVLDIDAPGLSAEGALKALQFEAPRGMRFYTPTASLQRIDEREVMRVTFSFVAEETDVPAFPAIHLPYFDPKTQRIESLIIPAARLSIRDPMREKIFVTSIVVLLALGLAWAGRKVWPWLKRQRIKRAWLARIDAANDVASLYRLLTRDAPWQAKSLWQSTQRLQADAQTVRTLEQLRFGSGAPSIAFANLKSAWRQAVARAPIRVF